MYHFYNMNNVVNKFGRLLNILMHIYMCVCVFHPPALSFKVGYIGVVLYINFDVNLLCTETLKDLYC
jgi:hypothetical protein